MDVYLLNNRGNTNIVGTVTGPGTWCYIKKNGKKGKVRQVYAGAKFQFSNLKYPDIKAYEITGSFYAIQRDLVSGEVHKHPQIAKSENSCKCKDEITLLHEKINELTSRCDKLEAAIVMQHSSLPTNTQNKKPRRRNRHRSHPYSCAVETPEFVLSDITSYCIRPIKASHVLSNCVDNFYIANDASTVDTIYPGKKYNEFIIDDILNKLSLFVRGSDVLDLLSMSDRHMMEMFAWADTVFGEYPFDFPVNNVGETFQKVFETHCVDKVVYSMFFVKENFVYMKKAYYATYLKYLTDCKERKYHPFNDARLAEFYEVNFKRVAP